MTGNAHAPTRRAGNRKAQLALLAAELFCARGYHGVGIDEIAAAAGISGPAIYRHFPTKYALLVHATRELAEAVRAEVTEGLAEGDTPAGQLDGALAALARLTVRQRKVGSLYQWEGRYLEPEHRHEFRDQLSAVVTQLTGPLRELRPELSAADADLLVRGAFSALASLTTHRAPIARGRAETLLRRLGATVLATGLPASLTPAAQPDGTPSLTPGARREVLLAAAIKLFHERGYHAVSIEDIGAAAGINASSVYRHFAGKGDLLAAAYYRAADRLGATITSTLATTDTPARALDQLTESYIGLAFAQPDLVSVYLAENTNLPEHDRHQLRKAQRLHTEEWVRLLTATRPDLPATDARIIAHAALNVVIDLGRRVGFDTRTGGDSRVAAVAEAIFRS